MNGTGGVSHGASGWQVGREGEEVRRSRTRYHEALRHVTVVPLVDWDTFRQRLESKEMATK